MRKLMLAAMLAMTVPLAACDPSLGVKSPAPLAQTTVDEKSLMAALNAFDVLLTAIDGLRDAGDLVPGSPKALKVKALIEVAQDGLNTAKAVRDGLSTEDPALALDRATSAFRQITALLKGN